MMKKTIITCLLIFNFSFTNYFPPQTQISIDFSNLDSTKVYIYDSFIYFDELEADSLIGVLDARNNNINLELSKSKYLRFKYGNNSERYYNVHQNQSLSLYFDNDILKSRQPTLERKVENLEDKNTNPNLSYYQNFVSGLDSNFNFEDFYKLQSVIYHLDYDEFLRFCTEFNSANLNSTFFTTSVLVLLREIINVDLPNEKKKVLFKAMKTKLNTKRELSVYNYLFDMLKRENSELLIDSTILKKHNIPPDAIIYFTATWCPPCIEAIDSVNKAINTTGVNNGTIIIFSLEQDEKDVEKIRQSYDTENVFVLPDASEHPIAKYFNISEVPTIIKLENNRITRRNWITPLELPGYVMSLGK